MTPEFVKKDPPHDTNKWVRVYYEIRDNETGEVRRYDTDAIWDEYDDDRGGVGVGDYIFSEGNFSCDCNRALFFAYAAGLDGPEDPDCGEKRYSMNVIHADGTPAYVEFGGDETK